MSLHFNLNNSVKKVKSIYANIGGSVKKVKSAWVSDGNGGVERVYSSAPESVILTNVREVIDNNNIYYSGDGITWNNIPRNTIIGIESDGITDGAILSKIIFWEGIFVCLCLKYSKNTSPGEYYDFVYRVRYSENLEDWETMQEFTTSLGRHNFGYPTSLIIVNTHFDIISNDPNNSIIFKFPTYFNYYDGSSPLDSSIRFSYKILRKNGSSFTIADIADDTIKMGLYHKQTDLEGSEWYIDYESYSYSAHGIAYYAGKYVTMLENPFAAKSRGVYLTSNSNLTSWSDYEYHSWSANKKTYPAPLGVFKFNGDECLIMGWQGSNNNVVLGYTFDTTFNRDNFLPILNNNSEVVIFNNVTSSDTSAEGGGWKGNHIYSSKVIELDGRYFVTFSVYRASLTPRVTYYSFELQYSSGIVTVKRQFSEPFIDIVKFNGNYYVSGNNTSLQTYLRKVTNFDSGNDFTYENIGNSNLGNVFSLTVKNE